MCACANNVAFENKMCDPQSHHWHTHMRQVVLKVVVPDPEEGRRCTLDGSQTAGPKTISNV